MTSIYFNVHKNKNINNLEKIIYMLKATCLINVFLNILVSVSWEWESVCVS